MLKNSDDDAMRSIILQMITILIENQSVAHLVQTKLSREENISTFLIDLIRKDSLRYKLLPSLACRLWIGLESHLGIIPNEILENVYSQISKQITKMEDKNIFFVFEKLRMVSEILRTSKPCHVSTQIECASPIWIDVVNQLTKLNVSSEAIYYAFSAIHCHISTTPLEKELIGNDSYIRFLKQAVASLLSSENVDFKLIAIGLNLLIVFQIDKIRFRGY